jgi:YD repeat-containing protein
MSVETWLEEYGFDATGNGGRLSTVDLVSGAEVLQLRTHNLDNAITDITDEWDGVPISIAVNAVGNTTTSPQPANWGASYTLSWDAWNRLVSVSDGTTPVASYAYDGLSRRTTKVTGATTRHYYYTPRWQIVEERLGTATTAERQFVWGLRAFDDLLLRDYGAQRMYAMHDYCRSSTRQIHAICIPTRQGPRIAKLTHPD